MTTLHLRKSIGLPPLRRAFFLIPLVFVCFGLLPRAQAVVPPPDGGYPGFNTAEGQNSLLSRTTGTYNTAVGFLSLRSLTEGSFNTGVGAGTLLSNTGGANTAAGAGALLNNTTGGSNTATGAFALLSNTTGDFNTANGTQALYHNTTGGGNEAFGGNALGSNVTGNRNIAIGDNALGVNVTGNDNTAIGDVAGVSITGSGNVCIGSGVVGVAGESDTTRIRNVYYSVASARAVYVNSDNKIGTLASSRRFKDEIKPMDKASETILALKPVTFHYKKEIEPNGAIMFGLIAEEVEKVAPELVTCNDNGEVETVRYDAVNAMLLNEFLKEHRKNEKQEATIAPPK